jgi:hypothetical protein
VKKQMAKFRGKEEIKELKKAANKKSGKKEVETESSSSESEEEEKEAKNESASHKEDWEKKRHHRTKEEIEREALLLGDLYAMLGLSDRTYEAGDSEIKQSYKKLALMYHPDKLGASITESDKEVWLKIQAAYETLID